MFGKNILSKKIISDGQSLFITEIFGTIQGEGPFAGEPAIFIRLAGCNLACYFCDTDFETNRHELSLDVIKKEIAIIADQVKTDLIVITGGEPMLQNIAPLVEYLLPEWRVQIETAGTVWVNGLAKLFDSADGEGLTIVCSPKTSQVNQFIQLYCTHWKYIVTADHDTLKGLPNMSTQVMGKRVDIARPQFASATIYLQPCDEHEPTRNRHNIDLAVIRAKKYGYRVCLQQHKIMGVE